MSLKSDNWIIRQNTAPTHELVDSYGDRTLIRPPYTDNERHAINNWCSTNERSRSVTQDYARPLRDPDAHHSPMITPFFDRPVRYVYKDTGMPYFANPGEEIPDTVRKVISFGTSSYGYDVRLKSDPDQIKVFTNVFAPEIDPKRMTPSNFATPTIKVDEEGAKYVMIPAHSYLQAPTMEYFKIPRDVMIIAVGKSTYARSGLICNVTPIEPEFCGEVVIEIANLTSSPVRCYLEEGICQFVIIGGDEACRTSYKDKAGKYQGQRGLQYAIV